MQEPATYGPISGHDPRVDQRGTESQDIDAQSVVLGLRRRCAGRNNRRDSHGVSLTSLTQAGPVTVVRVRWHYATAVMVVFTNAAGRRTARAMRRSARTVMRLFVKSLPSVFVASTRTPPLETTEPA